MMALMEEARILRQVVGSRPLKPGTSRQNAPRFNHPLTRSGWSYCSLFVVAVINLEVSVLGYLDLLALP